MDNKAFNVNLDQLTTVAHALGNMLEEVVFVAGSTTALLVDEAGTGHVRQTKDVDFIVDLISTADWYDFNTRLRELGFREDHSSAAMIGRWLVPYHGTSLQVDIMPVDPSIIGFSNQWYRKAVETAQHHTLPNGLKVSLVTPTYFLATKFEAFHSRSQGSYFSHDLEDIIYLIEHRSRLAVELSDQSPQVRSYLAEQARALQCTDFFNVLPGLLDDDNSVRPVQETLRIMADYTP